MTKRVLAYAVVCCMSLINCCKSQTNDQKIYQTSYNVIDALKQNDARKFISLIGFEDLKAISKTERMVTDDVANFADLYHEYFRNRRPNVEFTELYNFLGQKQVKLIFFAYHKDSAVKEMHLDLLYGPPNMVSTNKISGYELITNSADSSEFHPISYWHR
jgi:hypothetical protein